MEERYIGLSSDSQTRSRFKSENELSCNRPTIHIKPQPVEHIIEEIEVGPSSLASSPLSDIQSEGSPEGEIVPEIILKEDEDLDLDYKDETPNKWSHRNVLLFLETFNQVLNSEEAHGGFLSRKNLFTRVTHMLREKGIHFTQTDTEKKYNNMLMTYRRCQQRLLRLRKTPSWPYFKMMSNLRQKVDAMESASSNLHLTRLTEARRATRRRRPEVGVGVGGGCSFVSTLPQDFRTPECLTRDWQRKRGDQEERKAVLLRRVIEDRRNHLTTAKENRSRMAEALQREVAELSCLGQEVAKGRLQCGKEMRFLAQDAVCLASAVRSIRAKRNGT